MLLAGDIGGTKTQLAIYSAEKGPREPLVTETFPSRAYPNLEAMVREFLGRVAFDVEAASFGVAGPVIGNRVEITNLPWNIDAEMLRERLGLSSVRLLNDLASIANGVPFLRPDELYTLHEGKPDPTGAIAVVAPGTGLGQAYLTWDPHEKRYRPHPSEGGHTDFAPRTPEQIELLRYLMARYSQVSNELVCSGLGIPNLYAYYRDRNETEEPAWLTEALAAAEDPTPVIVNAALDEERTCELCRKTLDMFMAILGADAGNMALKVLATGGVYLGGGIPPRIVPALERGILLKTFQDKDRQRELMERIPVHVILEPEVALIGAACYGLGL